MVFIIDERLSESANPTTMRCMVPLPLQGRQQSLSHFVTAPFAQGSHDLIALLRNEYS